MGNALRGGRIWGVEERLREEIGSPLAPNERSCDDRRIVAVRAALGLDRARREGRALTLEQAMELAMEDVVGRP